jgi:DNA primase
MVGQKHAHEQGEDGQLELFAQTEGVAVKAHQAPPHAPTPTSAAALKAARPHTVSAADRAAMLAAVLEVSAPVRAGGKAAAWLKARRIFRKTWDAQALGVVENYRRASEVLLERFPLATLQAGGLFNKDGHLRFYRHSLLIPWHDHAAVVYVQAYAPEAGAQPPMLSTAGPVPCPYNAQVLDGTAGRLYVCAGPLDTLELIEAGFPAVGLPSASGDAGDREPKVMLKKSWLPRFQKKSVYVAFDGDAEGEAAAATVIAQLMGGGVEAHRVAVPAGKRVSDWVAGR